ncbi:type II secretion system minor pseudopilin GspK [Pseudidiomarina andamanensis]|uniref:General secretion pathway protein GspK n=1 Tax=Pseudidiomarina andamanensis TaxID=1940690 RepID=A0AA92EXD8_9GAMM|nr:type II secretion system minor pseudopilin GspK [Pseudidiomarina andamanensis]MDS0217725.1 type II secretion system minor pseudopilin GspK [Pseudidiomarina andamanensis]QGT96714.1 general secretion pathway protein GspK [Pseudidiomarina andamanensis]
MNSRRRNSRVGIVTPQHQRGVALLMVLLVVALVSVMAVTLSGRLQTTVLRTANFQQAEQAYWYWLSAEEIVRELLQREVSESDGVVHQQQMWYQQSQSNSIYPVDGGAIKGEIQDLQSCFNLNSLRVEDGVSSGSGTGTAPPSNAPQATPNSGSTPNAGSNTGNANTGGGATTGGSLAPDVLRERRKAQLRMLFMAVDENIESYAVDVIVDSLADWLDSDDDIDGSYGAESVDYQSLQFPYRAANSWLVHVSELRLVRGVTARIYNQIKPYVCVIPRDNSLKLNINTVKKDQPALLHAVTVGAMSMGDAASFLASRRESGYESMDDARNNGAINDAATRGVQPKFVGNVPPNGVTAQTIGGALDDLDVKSKYFQLNAKIGYGDLTMAAESQFLITSETAEVLYRGAGEP